MLEYSNKLILAPRELPTKFDRGCRVRQVPITVVHFCLVRQLCKTSAFTFKKKIPSSYCTVPIYKEELFHFIDKLTLQGRCCAWCLLIFCWHFQLFTSPKRITMFGFVIKVLKLGSISHRHRAISSQRYRPRSLCMYSCYRSE